MTHVGIEGEGECKVFVYREVISPVPVYRRCGCTLKYLVVVVEYDFHEISVFVIFIVVRIVPYLRVAGLLIPLCGFLHLVYLPDALELIGPDLADRLADKPAVVKVVVFLARDGIVGGVDVLDAVLVVGEAYRGVTLEVLKLYGSCVDRDFDTLVGYLAEVGHDASESGE